MSKDLKKLTDTDLKKTLEEKRKAVLDMRFNMTGSAKRNSKSRSNIKREVAQILTEQNGREKSKANSEKK